MAINVVLRRAELWKLPQKPTHRGLGLRAGTARRAHCPDRKGAAVLDADSTSFVCPMSTYAWALENTPEIMKARSTIFMKFRLVIFMEGSTIAPKRGMLSHVPSSNAATHKS